MNNDTVTSQIWDVISNLEVLEVNQDYVGESGGVYWKSPENISMGDLKLTDGTIVDMSAIPVVEYYSKPISSNRVAVLAMNHDTATRELTLRFGDIPVVTCDPCIVRDIWNHETIGLVTKEISVTVESHDSAFLLIREANEAPRMGGVVSSYLMIYEVIILVVVLVFSLRRLQLWCYRRARHRSS